jgi:hypothetical protein
MISNAGLMSTNRAESRLMSNPGLKEDGIKSCARMEYKAETPEHVAFLFETSAPPSASTIKMREHAAAMSVQCKAHGYYASACIGGFAIIGCSMFLLQFAVLFL